MSELTQLKYFLSDEAATLAFGRCLGHYFDEGVIYLEGPLGAGKTTLTRGVLQSAGYSGAVKSPTYTLVEVYELAGRTLCHFDLYRLSDPEELEYIGIRDYFSKQALLIVEWPSRGYGVLPTADITIMIAVDGRGRSALLNAHTPAGRHGLQRLGAHQE